MKVTSITAFDLQGLGACESQVRRFKRIFGKEGAKFTLTNGVKAHKRGMYVAWLVEKIGYWDEHDRIRRKIAKTPVGKKISTLERIYKRKHARLDAAFTKMRDKFMEEFEAAGGAMYSDAYYDAWNKHAPSNKVSRERRKLESAHYRELALLEKKQEVEYAKEAMRFFNSARGQKCLKRAFGL